MVLVGARVATELDVRRRSDLHDRELVRRARDGDRRSLDLLLRRHRALVRSVARRYFLRGQDSDDVLQEGTIGLYKAIRHFDVEQETTFRSYAELCISRQILTAIKDANRLKHTALNVSVSLDAPSSDHEGRPATRERLLMSRAFNPEVFVIAADEARALKDTLRRGLTRLEEDVLHLFLDGKSYEQIAQKLGSERKHIDNALQRVRSKVKRHLDHRHDGDG